MTFDYQEITIYEKHAESPVGHEMERYYSVADLMSQKKQDLLKMDGLELVQVLKVSRNVDTVVGILINDHHHSSV